MQGAVTSAEYFPRPANGVCRYALQILRFARDLLILFGRPETVANDSIKMKVVGLHCLHPYDDRNGINPLHHYTT